MNQDQQPRPWWSEHWSLLVLVALAVVLAVLVGLGYGFRWSWTGFTASGVSPPKLIWDWLELLIIPIVLGAGAFWLNTQTRKSEQAIAQDRAREEALQRYLDRMSELVLDKNLRESKQDDAARATARARTLTVLRSLDGNRKAEVVRFLYEADLIGKRVIKESGERQVIEAIINLQTSHLSNTSLSHANLSYANLSGANLSANLENADLRHADLRHADMDFADLISAKEEQVNEQLAQARSLVGATLPDGTTMMTEEAWEEFKKRYRK